MLAVALNKKFQRQVSNLFPTNEILKKMIKLKKKKITPFRFYVIQPRLLLFKLSVCSLSVLCLSVRQRGPVGRPSAMAGGVFRFQRRPCI